MAFTKTASAKVVNPAVDATYWNGQVLQATHRNRTASAQVITSEYDPSEWLLTHCTIVASVDTESGPQADKLGRVLAADGIEIERRYPDYYVKSDHDPWINNNHDCWERDLLLSSYSTFKGGYNFVEHIQIPELSKGTIIDAAARDIGDSVYIDILVATNRKHASLVRDIETKKLMTLSMGAIVAFTICTKCGNVAVDETDLCRHIRYEKGNYFIGSDGKRRRIAELCGHKSVPDSNKFIEASWVRDPAFAGAVLRNVLHVSASDKDVAKKIQVAYELGKRQIPTDQLLKVASQIEAGLFDFGQNQNQDGGQDPSSKEEAPKKNQRDKVIDELSKELVEKAQDRARKQILGPDDPRKDLTQDNDNLIHSSREAFRTRFASSGLTAAQLDDVFDTVAVLRKTGSWSATAKQRSLDGERLLMAAHFLDCFGVSDSSLTIEGYHAIMALGGTTRFASAQAYLVACGQQMGRQITQTEAEMLIRRGQIYSLGNTGAQVQ